MSSVNGRLEREGWEFEELSEGIWRARREEVAALAWAFEGAEQAARAALMHGPEVGAQLFVVPDLLARWEAEGALLTQDPGGAPAPAEVWSRAGAAQLAEQLGEALRKLHSLKVADRTFGDVREAGARWSTFNGFAASRLESHLEAANHDAALSQDERDALLRALDDLRHELSAFHPRYPAVWCHGAPGARALWVDAAGARVTGLVRFGGARLLPSEWDMACALYLDGLVEHDALVRSFYRGYGAARTMDMQRRERFFRRLVSLEALFGELESRAPRARLIEMAGPRA